MSDLIKRHLIKKIEEEIQKKNKILKSNNFLYLDQNIEGVNRLGLDNKPYLHEEILPIDWSNLRGSVVYEIYNKIKNNQVFSYKKILGKSYKIRLNEKLRRDKGV